MMLLFADEAVSNATVTANTALVMSVCTIVVVPLITLFIQKFFEGRRLNEEATLARAKVEAEAGIARAKLELDSKMSLLASQHQECLDNNAAIETKLEECERQHFVSAAEREKLKEESEENRRRIEKFEEFMAKHEARRQAAAENL